MSDPRTLRSKSLRHVLFAAADGHCERCGCDLEDGWHADHVEPWSATNTTNVHDMQALCPTCNLKKGNMKLRRHQIAINTICSRILEGDQRRKIIASVTPGGGKSLIPQIIAKRLIPSIADKICWVVPRLALQEQAAGGFVSDRDRAIVGHALQVRESTNDRDPSRGHAGYVTTYQAIVSNPSCNSDEFRRHRYILVLDEPHHIKDGEVTHRAIQSMVDRASLVVLMSGTLDRGDRKPIAFVPYRESERGSVFDDNESESIAVVKYGLRAALAERAIIPLHFTRIDCRAEWIAADGAPKSTDSLADAGDDTSAALYTALHTGYATELLQRCLDHWLSFRKHNRRAKMLVVCSRQEQARKLRAVLVSKNIRAEVATSDDSAEAHNAIRRFRDTASVDVLVTVAMAYEGLDVPAVTHIACLTNVRSRPWIHQMLARATRYDRDAGKYETQTAHAFVPDDAMMNDVIREIEEEQAAGLSQDRGTGGGGDASGGGWDITPLGSQLTRERDAQLTAGEMSYQETAHYRFILEELGVPHMPTSWAKRAHELFSRGIHAPEQPQPATTQLTAKQREKSLRDRLKNLAGELDNTVYAQKWGTANEKAVKRFNKQRKDMTELDLQENITYFEGIKSRGY